MVGSALLNGGTTYVCRCLMVTTAAILLMMLLNPSWKACNILHVILQGFSICMLCWDINCIALSKTQGRFFGFILDWMVLLGFYPVTYYCQPGSDGNY